jgi:hypothetical protein
MKQLTEERLVVYGVGLLLYTFGFMHGGQARAPLNSNPEYVNPRSIKFNVEDKDNNNKAESYAKINGKDYLFKMVNGEPKLVPYSLEYKIKTSMGGK